MIARAFTGLFFIIFALAILTQFPLAPVVLALIAAVAGVAVLLSK